MSISWLSKSHISSSLAVFAALMFEIKRAFEAEGDTDRDLCIPFPTTETDRLTASLCSLANANNPTATGSGLTSAEAEAAAAAWAVRAKRGGAYSAQSQLLSAETAWPVKRAAEIEGGDLVIGGLHMVHEREEALTCGPVMPQGGLQAAEVMLYTVDRVNSSPDGTVLPPGVKMGAYILDDCDKDTYGLQQAVEFIKGDVALDGEGADESDEG